jgi:ubiquinone/menaquinone biosynthesis C-methylase UbiE
MNSSEPSQPNDDLAQLYDDRFVPSSLIAATDMLLTFAAPKSDERVLDVACGTGVVARHVAARVGNRGSVVGLDIDPAMLAVARRVPPPTGAMISWCEGDAHALPFEGNSFDLVLCQQGLQYFKDPKRALVEMRRVLAPTGRLVVSVLARLEDNPFAQAFDRYMVKRIGVSAFGYAFAFGGEERMRALLTAAGCRSIEVVKRTYNAAFPNARILVETMLLRSTVIQAMFKSNKEQLAELIETVLDDTADLLDRYTVYDRIVFPITALIGRAAP